MSMSSPPCYSDLDGKDQSSAVIGSSSSSSSVAIDVVVEAANQQGGRHQRQRHRGSSWRLAFVSILALVNLTLCARNLQKTLQTFRTRMPRAAETLNEEPQQAAITETDAHSSRNASFGDVDDHPDDNATTLFIDDAVVSIPYNMTQEHLAKETTTTEATMAPTTNATMSAYVEAVDATDTPLSEQVITLQYHSNPDFSRFLFNTWNGGNFGMCHDMDDALAHGVTAETAAVTGNSSGNGNASTEDGTFLSATATYETRSKVKVTVVGTYLPKSTNDTTTTTNATTTTTTTTRLVVNFAIESCRALQKKISTGNTLEVLYALRLRGSLAYQATFNFSCPDAAVEKDTMIVPWMMGSTGPSIMLTAAESTGTTGTSTGSTTPEAADLSPPFWASRTMSLDEACRGKNGHHPLLGPMYKDMQFRLRTMAVLQLGGPPLHEPTHPSHKFAERYLTNTSSSKNDHVETWNLANNGYFANGVFEFLDNEKAQNAPLAWLRQENELDDVAIHFRCGDLMEAGNAHYEFTKFRGFAKFISSEARSIGIITTPFGPSNSTQALTDPADSVRPTDVTDLVQHRCRLVATAFADYLQERHPRSRVTIRNDQRESIMSSYVRLIMANQSIAGTASTFGVFPVLASFGTSYLTSRPHASSVRRTRWMIDEFGSGAVPGIVLSQEPDESVKSHVIKELFEAEGDDAVVAWFKS